MFAIDPMSQQPVYEQLVDEVERFVLLGILKSGSALPSVRSLSVSLSVNPNTIQKAYSELTSRGVVFSVPGKGCFVSSDAAVLIGKARRVRLKDLKEIAEELFLAGVPKKELIDIISTVYKSEEDAQ